MKAVHFAETGACPVDSPVPARGAKAFACFGYVHGKWSRRGEALALHKHLGHTSVVMTQHYLRSDDFDLCLSEWLKGEQFSAAQQDRNTLGWARPEAAAALLRVHQDMDRSQALGAHLAALDFQLDG